MLLSGAFCHLPRLFDGRHHYAGRHSEITEDSGDILDFFKPGDPLQIFGHDDGISPRRTAVTPPPNQKPPRTSKDDHLLNPLTF